MFKSVKGPKGGRAHPGLLYTGSQYGPPRRFSNRQIVVVMAVAMCFFMGYYVINSDAGTISTASTIAKTGPASTSAWKDAVLADDKVATPADANVHEVHAEIPTRTPLSAEISVDSRKPAKTQPQVAPKVPDSKQNVYHDQYSKPGKESPNALPYGNKQVDKPFQKPLDQVYGRPANQPSVGEVERAKQEVQADDGVSAKPYNPVGWKLQGSPDNHKLENSAPAPAREEWSDRIEFEKAIANIVQLLPDETHMREVLRPIDGSGKERMREMGLRTRAYRRYLEAWEAVHLTTDAEGATYIRDDVIQYLRSHELIVKNAEFTEDGSEGLGLAHTIRSYEAYRAFIQKFANLLFPWTAPYFSDHMSLHAHFKKGGRGIVLTAGDDQAPYLLTTIYTFRQLGCTLPIEVMYLGDQDLGEDYRAELEALPGVITRDIAQMTNDAGWKLAGWAAKPFAILLSSFREVIFIDADSLFFKNPEVLFEDPDYVKTGALFFKDRLIMPESKKRWLQQVLPKPIPKLAKQSRFWTGESGHMQESGVIVVDKWKHFVPMLLITRFNGPDRDGNTQEGIIGVYDMVYGDKETFWIGFLLAGDENYAFHAGDAGIMGRLDSKLEKDKDLRKREVTFDLEEDEKKDEPSGDEEKKEESKDEEPKKEEQKEEDKKDEKKEEKKEEQELPEIEESPQNHTICAPQLLHLDREGKPLWFNGWLLENKFAEKNKKRFARFEHYLVEPRKVREPGAWQLADSNLCCLTTDLDKTFEFSVEEKKTLAMIMKRAEEMGMGDQR